MPSFSLRKAIAAGLGATLVGAALTASLGAGVASAAPTCDLSKTEKAQSVGSNYVNLKKTVLNNGKVAPGGLVTFETEVSVGASTPPGLGGIIDYYPMGFELVSATLGGVDHTGSVVKDPSRSSVTLNYSPGWDITGKPTLVTTYRAPTHAKVGDTLDTGTSVNVNSWGWRQFNPMGVCVTVRKSTTLELLTGSLGSGSLGSIGS